MIQTQENREKPYFDFELDLGPLGPDLGRQFSWRTDGQTNRQTRMISQYGVRLMLSVLWFL